MDEITITDNAEFFVSSNKEVCVNQEVENNKNSSLDLDFDTSQQKIPPSVTIELSGQPTLDPEILSILSKYPHYVRPATLPEDIPFGIEVFFYPPMPWMDLNERLHCLDEYFRYDLPDILRTYPTTLIQSVEEDERLQYPKDPEPESPTLLNIESSNNPPESKHHLGNFHKPSRRIDICADFLRNLKISDFPFLTEQRKTFVAIDRIITCLRADYNQKDELSLKSELDLLMDLIASTDYPSVSQIRINRYVAALINELEFWIERAPITYTLIPGVNLFFVDPATYLINELRSIFPDSTEEAMDSAFFKRRKEIHVKLTQLLLTSKFPFTEQQKIYIREISQVVHSTIGNPDSEEEKEFQHVTGELLFDLCYIDTGFRDGISNPRKVRRAFNQFIDALLALGQEEKEFLREFDRYYINPADLIHSIIKALQGTFVLRHTFSHGSSLSESAVTSTDR